MTLDDLILWLQRGADRLIRRLRLEPSPRAAARRFLVIQIDGLSRTVFEYALARRRLRTLKRLLRRGQLVFRPMSVGIPSSTPAFQAGLFYGVNPDIPGFHWYDKRTGADVYFPRPGIADLVERRHAQGRRGIMEGGRCYGCVFTGGLFPLDQIFWDAPLRGERLHVHRSRLARVASDHLPIVARLRLPA